MSLEDQVMLTLIILRTGIPLCLAKFIFSYRVTPRQLYKTVEKMLFQLEVALRQLFPYPTSEEIESGAFLPEEPDFKQWIMQKKIAIIIDGTEFRADLTEIIRKTIQVQYNK